MTVFEALTWGSEQLKTAFADSQLHNPKFDAQVLLAHCIDEPTAYLFAHGDEVLRQATTDRYREMIERRAKHEPVAYILGEKEFFGRSFTVTPATLIPRPETELIVELAKAEIGQGTLVVDVGTGSGAIAVTLAADTATEVIAIDISRDALKVAQANAKRHDVLHRVAFLEGNLIKPFIALTTNWNEAAKPKELVITANLPYLTLRQWENTDADVKNFEPKTALVGGIDGLTLYDELFMQIAARRRELPKRLTVISEIDPSQASAFQGLVRHYLPEAKTEIFSDLRGQARVAIARL